MSGFVGMDEFKRRYSGRYFGKYRAVVTSISDPREAGRIMFKAPVVLGIDEELGWALPSPASGGGVNKGDFNAPEINDFVWIEFEEGDPAQPIWSPGPWGIRDGVNMLPKHSRAVGDDTDYVCRGFGTTPPSQFEGSYGNVRFLQNRDGGSFVEFDDTPGSERLQMGHRSGTRIEMTSDGGLQEVVIAGASKRVNGNRTLEVAGGETKIISGPSSFDAQKERTENYGADLTQTFGNVSQTGSAHTSVWSGNVEQTIGGQWITQAASNGALIFGGQLAFMVRQNLQMTVLENAEISVSNSLGLPTDDAVLIHGYNGLVTLKGTDITGLATESSVVLDGTPGIPSAEIQATIGGQGPVITLDGTPAAGGITLEAFSGAGAIWLGPLPGVSNVHLGGKGATEPFIKGLLWTTYNTSLLTALGVHTHPTAMGPSGPSVDFAAQIAGLTTQATNALSLMIFGV